MNAITQEILAIIRSDPVESTLCQEYVVAAWDVSNSYEQAVNCLAEDLKSIFITRIRNNSIFSALLAKCLDSVEWDDMASMLLSTSPDSRGILNL